MPLRLSPISRCLFRLGCFNLGVHAIPVIDVHNFAHLHTHPNRSETHGVGNLNVEGEALQKISWNQQNDFHFNYLLIDLQFVTNQKAAHLHICTYQSTFQGLMAWLWGRVMVGDFLCGRLGKILVHIQALCGWRFVQLCLPKLRIFNWKCYRIYEIVNMQTNTPSAAHSQTNMQVLTTYIWHIYIQLVCEIFAQKRKCKFSHTHTSPHKQNNNRKKKCGNAKKETNK